jgi:hypothetical protein
MTRRRRGMAGLSRAQVDALLLAAEHGPVEVSASTGLVLVRLGYLEPSPVGLAITERGRGAAAVLRPLARRRPDRQASLVGREALQETPDVTDAVCRMIVAIGRRVAQEDTDGLELLLRLDASIATAWRIAVTGLRGTYSDTQIGSALGVKKQAVQQRWPRTAAEEGEGS